MSIKKYIPWWSKVITKLVLSRLPVSYKLWKKLSLFEHGHMQQSSYVYQVFQKHFERVKPDKGFVSLEIGPGDSLSSAIVSKAFGGSASYLVDAGDFAHKDINTYQAMADFITQQKLPIPEIKNLKSLTDILSECNASYLTSGLSSLKSIPDKSVDFIWSQAVLEHIRQAEFLDTMKELRRIIRDNGACSHEVDLKDHLGGALNNLRFSRELWESDFMANSGFYTNRVRYSEMLAMFRKANFETEVIEVKRWSKLPINRSQISKEFRHLSDEELCISGFIVLLKPV